MNTKIINPPGIRLVFLPPVPENRRSTLWPTPTVFAERPQTTEDKEPHGN